MPTRPPPAITIWSFNPLLGKFNGSSFNGFIQRRAMAYSGVVNPDIKGVSSMVTIVMVSTIV